MTVNTNSDPVQRNDLTLKAVPEKYVISDIRKHFGRRRVLYNISFSVPAGSCAGIFGPNGCGKSTLLSILSGAESPDSGTFLAEGRDLFRNPSLFSMAIGYVPQSDPLIDSLTVKDNLLLWYPSRTALKRDLDDGLPARFGLNRELHTTAGRLSGGMKKRLSIACALASGPKLLLLDEPTAALDLACKAEIRSFLKEYTASGGSVILTTHEESDLSLADRAWYMQDGTLIPLSIPVTPEALLERMEGSHDRN